MIKSVWAVTPNGSYTLNLSRSEIEYGLLILNIDGLGLSKTDVHTTTSPNINGAIFQNKTRTQMKTIKLSLAVSPRASNRDKARETIYKMFPVQKEIVFGVETTIRNVHFSVVVEEIEMNPFAKVENAVITLLAPDPFPEDVNLTSLTFSSVDPLFSFPFSNPIGSNTILFGSLQTTGLRTISYSGDVVIGFDLLLHFTDLVENITLYDISRNRSMTIDTDIVTTIVGSPIEFGDDILVSTRFGNKTITFVRSGVEYNIIQSLGLYVQWLYLEPGNNEFQYDAETGFDKIVATLTYYNKYSGVA